MGGSMAAAALLLLGGAAGALCGASQTSGTQDELIAADRGIWQLMAAAPHADVRRLREALAPDYLDVDSGMRHSRDEALDFIRGLTKFSFQYDNAKAYALSPTTGYVTAELSYSSVQNGNAAKGKVLTTTVYRKEQGRWVAHLHTEMDMKADK